MDKIIKTTTGDASFILEEQFEDESKAEKGIEPTSSEVKNIKIKIDNIKWRKKTNE
tara:strand:+ start:305 stop:472 length:168 start_codon:yes stop_codon:yes gene_type:complete